MNGNPSPETRPSGGSDLRRALAEIDDAASRALHLVNGFRSPKQSLGTLDAEAAAGLITAASDVALVLDRQGVIRDLAYGKPELAAEWAGSWLGRPWIDTVTVESRPKIESLLQDAGAGTAGRARQVNHPSARGPDVPVLYSALSLGSDGRVVALGRDLQALSLLQQRLVAAQQSMERDYSRLRHAETRYRLLFQIASEAVMIVDARTHKVAEANPAAGQMLGEGPKGVVGKGLPDLFEPASLQSVEALLGAVRFSGRADEVQARLAGRAEEVHVSASLFRQENSSHFLVRISPLQPGGGAGAAAARSRVQSVVAGLPDGFVVTDLERRILTANAAFLDLAQLAMDEQARGEPLERWLGRSEVDLNVLVANLREHGSVRNFATVMRGEYGGSEEVEVSAVSVSSGEQPCLGFVIRTVGRRLATSARAGRELPRSAQQLTDLVGRMPLKDLVRETTDVIERLCIEAALELTGDNRVSAAEILGLSRQSLYVKLRRHGLGDLEPEGEG